MTEQEWLECNNLRSMFEFLERNTGERKLRLFVVACCRQNADLFTDKLQLRAIDTAERYADGRANEAEREAIQKILNDFAENIEETEGDRDSLPDQTPLHILSTCFTTENAWDCATGMNYRSAVSQNGFKGLEIELEIEQADFLREMFGNPFRPVMLDAHWSTSNVIDLARTIYEERAFERMPILADALMDAGCDNSVILDHCKGPNNHVRGCWLVAAILGKE